MMRIPLHNISRVCWLFFVMLWMITSVYCYDHHAQHVVLIGMEGVNSNVLTKISTPNIQALRMFGVSTMNARSTYTFNDLSGWWSVLSSMEADHTSPWRSQCAGIFRAVKLLSHGTTATFYSSRKIEALFNGGAGVDYAQYASQDYMVASMAASYIQRVRPTFTFVYLSNPGAAGRVYGRDSLGYKQALIQNDGYIGWILDALRDANMLERTLIVVTSDHGWAKFGHTTQQCQGRDESACMHVPWIVFGPGVGIESGVSLKNREVSTSDTAPTILSALYGAPVHSETLLRYQWTGRVVTEAFVGTTNRDSTKLARLLREYEERMKEFTSHEWSLLRSSTDANPLAQARKRLLAFGQFRERVVHQATETLFSQEYTSLPHHTAPGAQWHSEIRVSVNQHTMPNSPMRVMGVGNYSYDWLKQMEVLRLFWTESTGISQASFYTTLHRFYHTAVERLCVTKESETKLPPPPPPPKPKVSAKITTTAHTNKHKPTPIPAVLNIPNASMTSITYAQAMAAEVGAPLGGPAPSVPKIAQLHVPGADKTATTSATASMALAGAPMDMKPLKSPSVLVLNVPHASQTALTGASAAAALANAPLLGPPLPKASVKTLNVPHASKTALTSGAVDAAITNTPLFGPQAKAPATPLLNVPHADLTTLASGAAAAAGVNAPILGPALKPPVTPTLSIPHASQTALTSGAVDAAITNSPLLGPGLPPPVTPTLNIPHASQTALTSGAVDAAITNSPLLAPDLPPPVTPTLNIPHAHPTALTSGAAAAATSNSPLLVPDLPPPVTPTLNVPGAHPTALTSGAAAAATSNSPLLVPDLPPPVTPTLNIPHAHPTALTSGAAAAATSNSPLLVPDLPPPVTPTLNVPGAHPTALTSGAAAAATSNSPLLVPDLPPPVTPTLNVPGAHPTALTSGAAAAATSNSPLLVPDLPPPVTPTLNVPGAHPTALTSGAAAAATTNSPILGPGLPSPVTPTLNVPGAHPTALTSGAAAAATSNSPLAQQQLSVDEPVNLHNLPNAHPTAVTLGLASAALTGSPVFIEEEVGKRDGPLRITDELAVLQKRSVVDPQMHAQRPIQSNTNNAEPSRCILYPSRYRRGMRPPNSLVSSPDNGKVTAVGSETIDGIPTVDYASASAVWNLGGAYHFFVNISANGDVSPIRLQKQLTAMSFANARSPEDMYEIWDFGQVHHHPLPHHPRNYDVHQSAPTPPSVSIDVHHHHHHHHHHVLLHKSARKKQQSYEQSWTCTVQHCHLASSFIQEYLQVRRHRRHQQRHIKPVAADVTETKSPYHAMLYALQCCRRLEKSIENPPKPPKKERTPARVAHENGMSARDLRLAMDDFPIRLKIAETLDGRKLLTAEDHDVGTEIVRNAHSEQRHWKAFQKEADMVDLDDKMRANNNPSIWNFNMENADGLSFT